MEEEQGVPMALGHHRNSQGEQSQWGHQQYTVGMDTHQVADLEQDKLAQQMPVVQEVQQAEEAYQQLSLQLFDPHGENRSWPRLHCLTL